MTLAVNFLAQKKKKKKKKKKWPANLILIR